MLSCVLNNNQLSSHISHINERINSSNQKIHSYDKIIKIIVNLDNKKCENYDIYSCQLTNIQNQLLMSIVDTPEKDLYNADRKSDTRRVRTSSVKSSSTRAMYNRVNFAKKFHVEVISSRD